MVTKGARSRSSPDVSELRIAWDALAQWHPTLKDLPRQVIKAIGRELTPHALARREVLFFEGELGETAYVVTRGVLTVTCLDSRRRRSLFAILSPGNVIGINPGKPEWLRRRLRADAFSECLVGEIDRRRLVKLLFGAPYERFAVAAEVAFGASSERLAQMMVWRTLPLRERLLALVAYLATCFGKRNPRRCIVDLPLTQADLADLVGASRPKVSRELGLLRKEGLLLHERHHIELNYGASLPPES